jgi:hypothetical protein
VRPKNRVIENSPTNKEIQEFKDWVNERNARWGLIPRIRKENEKDGMQPNQDARGISAGVVRNEPDGIRPKGPEGSETPPGSTEPETDAVLFNIPPLQALPPEGTGTVDDGVPQTWEVDEIGV